jgi:hypothetical protein
MVASVNNDKKGILMMKRRWMFLVGVTLVLASHGFLRPLEADDDGILVTGGGQGTFGSDLDSCSPQMARS